MSGLIGALVSSKIVTLAELQSVYGTEDAYDLLEIITVDSHNQKVVRDYLARQAR